MPTFSIIVPAFNAEKTLHKCLRSLCAQTYQDFEVHMVENGSDDGTRAICREYAEKDPRFLLHASDVNRGPSGARNIGLEHAKGTFIAFLDSDDYVEPDYLEALCQSFEHADVVFFGYHEVSIDGFPQGDHIPKVTKNDNYYDILLQLHRQNMFGYTWIKAFRRELIDNHRFIQDLNLLEDEVFTCEVLMTPCRIAVLPKAILNYVTGNTGSLIGRTHQDYCRKVNAAYRAWVLLLEPYDKANEALEKMANAHVNRCMYYGFERDVDIKMFVDSLSKSDFFNQSTLKNKYVTHVRWHNYMQIRFMKTIYRVKNKLAKLLKR